MNTLVQHFILLHFSSVHKSSSPGFKPTYSSIYQDTCSSKLHYVYNVLLDSLDQNWPMILHIRHKADRKSLQRNTPGGGTGQWKGETNRLEGCTGMGKVEIQQISAVICRKEEKVYFRGENVNGDDLYGFLAGMVTPW